MSHRRRLVTATPARKLYTQSRTCHMPHAGLAAAFTEDLRHETAVILAAGALHTSGDLRLCMTLLQPGSFQAEGNAVERQRKVQVHALPPQQYRSSL